MVKADRGKNKSCCRIEQRQITYKTKSRLVQKCELHKPALILFIVSIGQHTGVLISESIKMLFISALPSEPIVSVVPPIIPSS